MTPTSQPSRDEATRGCKPRPAAVDRAPEQAGPAPERATGEVEERLRSILDDAPIMVYVYDSEGRLLFGNREFERVLGVDRDALIGKTRVEFFSPEDAAVHRAHDLAVLASGGASRLEETLLQADGEHTSSPTSSRCATARAAFTPLRDLHRHHRAQACRRGNASERRTAGRGAGHLPCRQLGLEHRRRPARRGQTRCIGSSARLRRGSPPTTRGFSAGCIRTIAGRSSGRSTTR